MAGYFKVMFVLLFTSAFIYLWLDVRFSQRLTSETANLSCDANTEIDDMQLKMGKLHVPKKSLRKTRRPSKRRRKLHRKKHKEDDIPESENVTPSQEESYQDYVDVAGEVDPYGIGTEHPDNKENSLDKLKKSKEVCKYDRHQKFYFEWLDKLLNVLFDVVGVCCIAFLSWVLKFLYNYFLKRYKKAAAARKEQAERCEEKTSMV